MRWNGYRTSLIVFAAIVGITGGLQSVQVKAEKKNAVNYALSDIAYSDNGGETRLTIEGNKELTISMDTNSLAEGYYTSFFYTDVKKTIGENQVVAISLNTSKGLVMNLNLIDEKGNAFSCKDGQVVYLKETASSVYTMATVENGSFHVPAQFSGTVYIPVSMVVSKEEVGKLSQLAFVLTQQENEQTTVSIKKLQMLFENEKESKVVNAGYMITGEKKPTIPAVGEYQYAYQLYQGDHEVEEQKYSVSLREEVPGVSISSDGILTICEESKVGNIPLLFTLEDGQQFSYEVTTVTSWLSRQAEGNNAAFSLPSTTLMTQYRDETENHRKMQGIEDVLRMLLVGAAVCYMIFYTKHIKEN